MKKYFAVLMLAAINLAASAAKPQSAGTTAGTNLMMAAHWDDKTDIQGTVTLAKVNLSGPDTVVVTKTLSNGFISVTEPLDASAVYNVTLRATDGTQLVKFPITTALINPSNLKRAEIQLVCRAADRSLASAQISVSMKF